ncbi:MAG: hypothetical protein JJT75_04100 [Opitutales bacterium]|nr:hypothetical protein [Opitutales bacterium]MCH8539387.1 hypothetical protein [Opitutales bacterium]
MKSSFFNLFSTIAFVGIPAFLVLGYLLFFAQPTYETETQIVIRENGQGSGMQIPGITASVLGGAGGLSYEEGLILQQYLESASFAERASDELDLIAHFSEPRQDRFRTLSKDPTKEALRRFIRRMVRVQTSSDSGIVVIRVRAFTPEFSQKLTDFVLTESERRINELNRRMVDAKTSSTNRELQASEERVQAIQEEVLSLQLEYGMVDPTKEVAARFDNISSLDQRLVEARTQIRVKSSFMQENSSELRRLRGEMEALEKQREEEVSRALKGTGENNIADLLRTYENLQQRKELALTSYGAAFAMAEQAKMEASRQEKFILVISPTHLPEEPVFPQPGIHFLIGLLIILFSYSIGRLVWATVQDHTV